MTTSSGATTVIGLMQTAVAGAAIATMIATSSAAAPLPGTSTPLAPNTGSLTLNDGSTASFVQNNIGQASAGTITGTITPPGGTSTPFSCAYDVARRQLTGSPACAQVLGGATTGGINLVDLERQAVAARVDVVSHIQANADLQVLNDLTQRRIGLNLAAAAQAQMQVGGTTSASAFGSPQFQSWGFAGGDFLSDDRLGLKKSGHGVVATAGVDHTAGNLLLGGYAAYLNTDLTLDSLDGSLSSDGWALGGYATYVFNSVLSASVSGSYGDSTVNMNRAVSTAPVTAKHGHQEWSLSATGNAFWRLNSDLGLSALAGVDYGKWIDSAYVDSAGIQFNEASEGSTWGKVGTVLTLWPGAMFEPYATAIYSHLLSDPQFVTNRDALTLGGGLELVSGRLSGGLEVDTLLLQDGQSDTTIGLNIRFRI